MIGGAALAAVFWTLAASGLDQAGLDAACPRSPSAQAALAALEAGEDGDAGWSRLIAAASAEEPACEAAVLELAYRAGCRTGPDAAAVIAALLIEAGDPGGAYRFLRAELESGGVPPRVSLLRRTFEAGCAAHRCVEVFDLIEYVAEAEARSLLFPAALAACREGWPVHCARRLERVMDAGLSDDAALGWMVRGLAYVDGNDRDRAMHAFEQAVRYPSPPEGAEEWLRFLQTGSRQGRGALGTDRAAIQAEECRLVIDAARRELQNLGEWELRHERFPDGDIPDRCAPFYDLRTGRRLSGPSPDPE